ncbi:MAG: DNA recombination protein RmuC [Candidatus Kryptoniota bacterium]
MEPFLAIIFGLLFILLLFLIIQNNNRSNLEKLSLNQIVQMVSMFKSEVDSTIRSVTDSMRTNIESFNNTIRLVSEAMTRSMEENRSGTNAQIEQMSKQISQLTSIVANRVESLRGALEQRMTSFEGQLGGTLSDANRLFSSLKEDFGELKKSSNNLMEIGKQINQLQNILNSPKLRGNFGETVLEELIKQVIPLGLYEFQYTFRDGTKVDAIIKTSDRIISIDSKFPMEDFRRYTEAITDAERSQALNKFVLSVKRHVDAVAEKYIKPSENTFDFAIMFVPSESIYYEILLQDKDNDGVYMYALRKHVVPASPNSFYAYLQAIAVGLKGLQIEKNAKLVRDQIAQLENTLSKFEDFFETLGKHINNTVNKYNESHEALAKFKYRFDEIKRLEENEQGRVE